MALTAHLALGWTLFAISLIVSAILAWCFVLWLRSVRENERSTFTNVVVAFCLCVTVISAGLVPVDVYTVSSMKHANGSYENWAKDATVRHQVQLKIQVVYYVLFGIVLALSFIILPMVFFFHTASPLAEEDGDENREEESTGHKLCRAFKYTTASVILLIALILLGIFLPFETTQKELLGTLHPYLLASIDAMKVNEGFEMIVFVMNSISVIGLGLLVLYTGIGMSSLPCRLIRGTSETMSALSRIDRERNKIEKRLEELRTQDGGLNTFEEEEATRLDQELIELNRRRDGIAESSRGCCYVLYRFMRPFQIVFGILFLLLGLLIFLALLLNNIDKAIHSSAKAGYILANGTLPNPMDMTLVYLQRVFPLDYILFLSMVLLFLMTSIGGVTQIGIRFMWLPLYKIAPHSTKPQALALMSLTLILILVASNILFFSIAPNYTTYGSQRFVYLDPITNHTSIEHCDDEHAPQDECNMTTIATFLLALHTKAWIFGAVYYWFTWLFLLLLFGGSCMALYQCARRDAPIDTLDDEDELIPNAGD